ncbi:Uma2 family endonuclease [Kitasatospora sp. NPDC052896]|uniref:Uma2 family endonuclease n=1 Tax=Kitasatospora sp. NPDC052896 TaxID=3364061 RepID=UPI0037C8BCD5
MSVVAFGQWTMPDSPYALWVRGELAEFLRIPDDGTRVEVVGGEFVVSPAPAVDHNIIVSDINRGVVAAELRDGEFPLRAVQTTELDLVEVSDGYIPDLMVLNHEVLARAGAARAQHLYPHQLMLVVEVTSPSNAAGDHEPAFGRGRRETKWNGYARSGVPFYLLVDRDPRNPGVTLYADPDQGTGRYRERSSWPFGTPVKLPEPLGFEFSTDRWRPWSD